MDAVLSGRLINPFTQNLLDSLLSRVVVTVPKDKPGLPPGGLLASPETADSARLDTAAAAPARVLDQLVSNGFAEAPGNTAAENTPAGAVATQAGFVAASYTSLQSTSLVVNTQDGDRVTIDITRQATTSRTEVAGIAGDVRGLIDEAAVTRPLAEPARDVAKLFTALTRERASAFGFDALKSDAMSMLRDLVGRIVDSYKTDRTDSGEENNEQNDSEREEVAERAA